MVGPRTVETSISVSKNEFPTVIQELHSKALIGKYVKQEPYILSLFEYSQ